MIVWNNILFAECKTETVGRPALFQTTDWIFIWWQNPHSNSTNALYIYFLQNTGLV